MASKLHRLSFTALRYSRKGPLRLNILPSASPTCQLHCAPITRAPRRQEDGTVSTGVPANAERQAFEFKQDDLSADELAVYRSLKPDEQAMWREEMAEFHKHMSSPEFTSQMNAEVSLASNEMVASLPHMSPPPKLRPDQIGFLAEDEDEPDDIGEDPTYEGDDISSLAHGELEQHREMREYARIAVWEMPLLYKHAKSFEPPSLERPLRFRQTTYLGESHPAAKKIVCEFCTKDIAAATSLTEPQRIKLVKLVGVRYNPDTDVVKMACESHETPAQNKRYLADLVQTLVKEAKDESDMFEDVPLDFRHHKPKKVWVFPEEWKLDEERKQKLAAERERLQQIEQGRGAKGQLVEGKRVLEEALKIMSKETAKIIPDSRQIPGRVQRLR